MGHSLTGGVCCHVYFAFDSQSTFKKKTLGQAQAQGAFLVGGGGSPFYLGILVSMPGEVKC